MNKTEIISEVEQLIEENKDTFYRIVLDIKSGHSDFPPEVIMESLGILGGEITDIIRKLDV